MPVYTNIDMGLCYAIQNVSDVCVSVYLMYVCPCIIYEIEERYPLDATIYLLL